MLWVPSNCLIPVILKESFTQFWEDNDCDWSAVDVENPHGWSKGHQEVGVPVFLDGLGAAELDVRGLCEMLFCLPIHAKSYSLFSLTSLRSFLLCGCHNQLQSHVKLLLWIFQFFSFCLKTVLGKSALFACLHGSLLDQCPRDKAENETISVCFPLLLSQDNLPWCNLGLRNRKWEKDQMCWITYGESDFNRSPNGTSAGVVALAHQVT